MKENKKAKMLRDCSVKFMEQDETRQRPVLLTEKSIDLEVSLSKEIKDCYVFIFAYAGNTTLDFDSDYNQRLWYGKVQNDTSVTCFFTGTDKPLRIGYKIAACMNVPIGEDEYGYLYSQALDIVDESGEKFQDYQYPDAKIVDTDLIAGQTAVHISLSGDERLFQAAREKKISIVCSIAQYPVEDTFDFENPRQISLASNIQCNSPFENREIQLSQPLIAGYRVRAVVYWSQNVTLLLVKGNDYESTFHCVDDSVMVL